MFESDDPIYLVGCAEAYVRKLPVVSRRQCVMIDPSSSPCSSITTSAMILSRTVARFTVVSAFFLPPVSAVIPSSMVFVLWYYQDRPQADWQQSYFTLNGLVAFLATLIKTGLVIPVSAAIGQRKWLRFLPGGKKKDRARRLGDFETFDEASRVSLGSAKLVISLNAWYDFSTLS